MKAVVIGATGIIGNHIVRELLKAGHSVVAVSRGMTSSQNLEGLDVQFVKADLADANSLKVAFAHADWVFQAAAYYPKDCFHRARHVQSALAEIKNIVWAAQNSDIERLIYTSSLTTIGQAGPGKLADETFPYDFIGHDPHPYFLVKHLCEQELLLAVHNQKLPVVMVNPTGCFGPYELKPKYNCLIPQLVERSLPAIVDHAMNVVDVADVARGHIYAAQKGRIGEKYILGGHNTTVSQVVKEICELAGVQPPRFRVPVLAGLALCYLNETWSVLRGKSPSMPALGLNFVRHGQHYSLKKSVDCLGYEVHSMRSCYEQAIAWYKKIGYC